MKLVAVVVLVDAAFIGLYVALHLASADGPRRLGFTLLWTVVTLVVVLRSLGRVRAARLRLRRR